jgi:integrase
VVPLVGSSLWAAKRIKEAATNGQAFAFPRYNKTGKTNSNSASAALNKWIKGTLQQDHIVHELRHTLADRLREVQCPADVRLAIGGWDVKGVGEGYGDGYTLRVRAEWLDKVVDRANVGGL